MQAVIVHFRGGKHTQTNDQMILQVEGVDSRDKAAKLVAKSVSWKSPAGKILKGKVVCAHGRNGAVRAKFDTGMPGQSVGKLVEIA